MMLIKSALPLFTSSCYTAMKNLLVTALPNDKQLLYNTQTFVGDEGNMI